MRLATIPGAEYERSENGHFELKQVVKHNKCEAQPLSGLLARRGRRMAGRVTGNVRREEANRYPLFRFDAASRAQRGPSLWWASIMENLHGAGFQRFRGSRAQGREAASAEGWFDDGRRC